MYMPVASLRSCDPLLNPNLPHQDAHDDMQSFYFVLYEIMHTFYASGARFPSGLTKAQVFLDGCGDNKPSLSATFKEQHLFSGLQDVGRVVSRTWLRPSVDLLKSFFKTIRSVAEKKNLLLDLNNDRKLDDIKDLDRNAGQHFAEVIAEFDIAIAQLAHLDEQADENFAISQSKVEIVLDKEGDEYETEDTLNKAKDDGHETTTKSLSAILEKDEAPANHSSANPGPSVLPSTPKTRVQHEESPWRPAKRSNTLAELSESDEDGEDAGVPDTPCKQSKDKRPRII